MMFHLVIHIKDINKATSHQDLCFWGLGIVILSNTENGCDNQETIEVLQDIVTPTLDIITPDTLNCIILQFNIDASNSSSGLNFEYEWTTADGNILGGSNTNMPLINMPLLM